MTMYYYIIVILLIAYGFSLFQWNKRTTWRLNDGFSNWIKKLHYILLGLVVVDILMISILGFHFRGLWTSRIFILGFIFSGLFLYPLSHGYSFRKLERIYFIIFGYLPVGLGLFMLIPFLGAVTTVSIGYKLISPAETVFYEDSNIRIQQTFTGALGSQCLDLIEKSVIMEGVNFRLNNFDSDSYDSLYVDYASDSIRIKFTSDQYWCFDTDTVFVDDLLIGIENKNNIPPTKNIGHWAVKLNLRDINN